MSKALGMFKRFVVLSLMALMSIIVAFSIVDLAWLLVVDLMTPPTFLLETDELLDIFGLFLLILIGLELLDTVITYLSEHVIHVEIVFMVAMIAVARKVIILDVKELPFTTTLSIAAIVLALAAAYYFFKRANRQ